ncbi:MAG: Transposase, partial [Actinobacteria bacterium]|nr:Transposase [Actinomycetota bacterium]
MRRSYKFRLRPTGPQHGRLNECLKSHRGMYNAALQERRESWEWWKTYWERTTPPPK